MAGGRDLGDRRVVAGEELVGVLAAGDAGRAVALPPGAQRADVAVPQGRHLVLAGLDLAQPAQDGDLEAAVLGQRGDRLLGPDEVGGVDRVQVLALQPVDQGAGLGGTHGVQVGAGDRGVEEAGHIARRAAVANKVETHGPHPIHTGFAAENTG